MPRKTKATKSVQKTKGPPKTRETKRKADAARLATVSDERAKRKGQGDTKADRRQSGRAAAFAQVKARKPNEAVVEDVVEAVVEDVVVAVVEDAFPTLFGSAAAKAATTAMFSDDDDDDAALVDKPAPEPFTPSKCAGELFVTPSKCHIIVNLRVTCQSFARGTGKKGTATVGKMDGVENETAIARAGEDVINKACGICWKSGVITASSKRGPAWPNPASPLRGFRFKRLEHEGPLVPRSLYIGLREIVEYYNCDMKNVAAAVQV